MLFGNDVDARRTTIREWYRRFLGPPFLGREPESEQTIQGWLAVWAAHGGEAVYTALRDSGEAANRQHVEAAIVAHLAKEAGT